MGNQEKLLRKQEENQAPEVPSGQLREHFKREVMLKGVGCHREVSRGQGQKVIKRGEPAEPGRHRLLPLIRFWLILLPTWANVFVLLHSLKKQR